MLDRKAFHARIQPNRNCAWLKDVVCGEHFSGSVLAVTAALFVVYVPEDRAEDFQEWAQNCDDISELEELT